MSWKMTMRSKTFTRNALRLLTGAAIGSAIMSVETAEAQGVILTVRAAKHAYKNVPVTIKLSEEARKRLDISKLPILARNTDFRGQIIRDGKEVYLTFILPELAQGASKTFALHTLQNGELGNVAFVEKKENDVVIDVFENKKRNLFTRYSTQGSPFKPFLYPILTPEGEHFTRRYPQEKVAGESQDHIHHRGLWFTHGDVNGVDFWAETEKSGRTVHIGYEEVFEGPVCAGFTATTEWRAPDTTLVATDRRFVRVTPLPNGDKILDFDIHIKPNGKELKFGDTKEGSFGLRVNEALAPKPDKSTGIATPTGKMVNSRGDKDGAAWGKKAEWVDYFGPIGGKTYGVAIFDHPKNFRYPTTWHARDYGLFTVNPFGLHDFGMGDKGAGDFVVKPDETFTLRYRVLFHKGDTEAGGVASQFAVYAEPPEVEIR
jgi:hypothetical protein